MYVASGHKQGDLSKRGASLPDLERERESVCVCERQRRDEGGRGGREKQRFVCELLARIARERTVNIEGVVVKRRRKLFGVVSSFFFR